MLDFIRRLAASVRAAAEADPYRDPPAPEAAADRDPWNPAEAARPRGARAGWLDGLTAYGPGYDPTGTAHILIAGRWRHPDRPPAQCRCGNTNGLTLIWLSHRPDLARMWCPTCDTAWTDPVWTTPEATARAIADQHDTPRDPRDTDDVHPSIPYQVEMIRRQAGNTRPTAD